MSTISKPSSNHKSYLKKTALATALGFALGIVPTLATAQEALAAAPAPAAASAPATPEKIEGTPVVIPGVTASDGTNKEVIIGKDDGKLYVDGKAVNNVTISWNGNNGSMVSVNSPNKKPVSATIQLKTEDNKESVITFDAPVIFGERDGINIQLQGTSGKTVKLVFNGKDGQPAYKGNINVYNKNGKAGTLDVTFKGDVDGNLTAQRKFPHNKGGLVAKYHFSGDSSLEGSVNTISQHTYDKVDNLVYFDDPKGKHNKIESIVTTGTSSTGVYAKAKSQDPNSRVLEIGTVTVKGSDAQNNILITTADLNKDGNNIKLTATNNGYDYKQSSFQTSIPLTTDLAGTLIIDKIINSGAIKFGKSGDAANQRATNVMAAGKVIVTGDITIQGGRDDGHNKPDGLEKFSRNIFITKDLDIKKEIDAKGSAIDVYFVGDHNRLTNLVGKNGEFTILNTAVKNGEDKYTTSLDIGNLTLKKADNSYQSNLNIKYESNGESKPVEAKLRGNILNLGGTLKLDSKSLYAYGNGKEGYRGVVSGSAGNTDVSSLALHLGKDTVFEASGDGATNTITLTYENDKLTSDGAHFIASNKGKNTIEVKGQNAEVNGLYFIAKGNTKPAVKPVAEAAAAEAAQPQPAPVVAQELSQGENIINLKGENAKLTNVVFLAEGGKNTVNVTGKQTTLNDLHFEATGENSENNLTFTGMQGNQNKSTVGELTFEAKDQGKNTVTFGSADADLALGGAKNLEFNAINGGVNKLIFTTNDLEKLTFKGDGKAGSLNEIDLGESQNLNAKNVTTYSGNTKIAPQNHNITFNGAVNTIGATAVTTIDFKEGIQDSNTFTAKEAISSTNGGKTVFNIVGTAQPQNGQFTYTVKADGKNIQATNGGQSVFELGKDKNNHSITLKFDGDGQVVATGVGAANTFNLNGTPVTIEGFDKVVAKDGATTEVNLTKENQSLTLDKFADGTVTNLNVKNDGITLTGDLTSGKGSVTNINLDFAKANSNTQTLTLGKDGKGAANVNLNFNTKDAVVTLKNSQPTMAMARAAAGAPAVQSPEKYLAQGETVFNFNQGVTVASNLDVVKEMAAAVVAPAGGAVPAAAGAAPAPTPAQENSITFDLKDTTVYLTGNDVKVTTVKGKGTVDLTKGVGVAGAGAQNTPADYRLFTVNGDKAGQGLQTHDVEFKLRANPNAPMGSKLAGQDNGTYGNVYSDRVVVSGKGSNAGNYVLVLPAVTTLKDSKYTAPANGKNIGVAVTDRNDINFISKAEKINGDDVRVKLVKVKTDDKGKTSAVNGNTYYTYFVDGIESLGVSQDYKDAYITALQLNSDLLLANFGSVAQRLGDLRLAPQTEGAWVRIFGGTQSNSTGLAPRTHYKTLQAGYDRLTNLFGKDTRIGVAVAYDASKIRDIKPLSGAKAKAVELAVYNSYVPAQGLYSDTVAKLSFLRSQFNVGKTIHVNNYAFSLSQELGYLVYLDQKQDWSLTPSYELGLGYINKSDFNYINSANAANNLYGVTQHNVKKAASTVLRNRVGVTLDYRFNPEYLDRAYFSVFYENDSYFGGKTRIHTQNEKLGVNANVSQKALRNDGRAVLNFGINSTLNKNVGLYLDAQKSFGGKINTDFQLNGGLRFSF
ncbi:hypothetical protein CEP48_02440 [Mergibacter septicus]|uniref:Uncharacterized protein n=1 Tax=Mergibacter septicus TaxID=221402 RepID=A0A8D4IZK6_9PAST|nr:autotransporter outer membrane beta-barrel domain-containing protein [Mergibacter septicus]AWX15087.1 hypothetical protein CEP47_02440 [Mergibacter septicus]QDJ14340.1 hypothetical protein CEP48_02440 [Mergibacter septicus]UTU48219.1 autotransporter outer membrane beta-barrel domain-containing protein [Mergibacter septicus]WMR96163.1 autotransporter outer membrane beta-barrel domain-containing protein [Mergibacter septicus]